MPIFVEHMPVSLTAQAAGNVGANRNAAQSWQEQVQAQQLARQQQEMQLRLQQEQDRSAQQDFRNSLDLAQYNRQMGQGQALNDYRTNSLKERTQHGIGVIDERKLAREQRESDFKQKLALGQATEQDTRQHWQDQADARNDEIDLQRQRGKENQYQFDTTSGQRQQRLDATDTRFKARMEWDQRKNTLARGDKMSAQEYAGRRQQLNFEKSYLQHQADILQKEEAANQYFPAKLAPIHQDMVNNFKAQQDLESHSQEIEAAHRQSLTQPTTQPSGVSETDTPTQGMPQGVQGSEAGYYIGQVIDTPKGKAIVTGLTNPNDPDVRLVP